MVHGSSLRVSIEYLLVSVPIGWGLPFTFRIWYLKKKYWNLYVTIFFFVFFEKIHSLCFWQTIFKFNRTGIEHWMGFSLHFFLFYKKDNFSIYSLKLILLHMEIIKYMKSFERSKEIENIRMKLPCYNSHALSNKYWTDIVYNVQCTIVHLCTHFSLFNRLSA